MNRGKELSLSLGYKILFPRLCLYGIVPGLLLLGPGNIAWLAYWSPAFDWFVLALFSSLFLLNVGANLAVSRYLRLHQSAASPYEYSDAYDPFTYTPYFRIQVKDRVAFRRLIKNVRAERKGEPIWVWLWLDDLLFVPGLLIVLVGLVWVGGAWLARRLHWRMQRALHPKATGLNGKEG